MTQTERKILLTLARMPDATTLEIVDYIDKAGGGRLSTGAFWVAAESLEEAGLVVHRLAERRATSPKGGRRVRFSITAIGKRSLTEMPS